MLTRLYIDNFRCFVNFEYRPRRTELIIGRNGCGKSSMMDALVYLRHFITRGDEFDAVAPMMAMRTRWQKQAQQTFEIEATLDRWGSRWSHPENQSTRQSIVRHRPDSADAE